MDPKSSTADRSPFGVRASAGSLRAGADGADGAALGVEGAVVLAHQWTVEGVLAAPVSNGAQALHLAVALCVLNDVYREASVSDLRVEGVAVEADGGFDASWASTGIHYQIEVDSPEDESTIERLLRRVEDAAEIPRAIAAGAKVQRR
jgi:hypothetical protein